MIKKFLNPSDKLTYEKALEQAGERVENLMKPNILVKGINNSDSRFKFKEKGTKRLFKKEAERERYMTQQSPTSEIVHLSKEESDYINWKKLSSEQKQQRRNNIAKAYLNSGPNIINLWNAFLAYIGNKDPENPHLNIGEPSILPGRGVDPKTAQNITKGIRTLEDYLRTTKVSAPKLEGTGYLRDNYATDRFLGGLIFESSLPEEAMRVQGHGMAKSPTILDALARLRYILDNGFEKGKTFYTAPLKVNKEALNIGSILGTGGGTPYFNGHFLITGKPGLMINSVADISTIYINDAYQNEEALKAALKLQQYLQKTYPKINFKLYSLGYKQGGKMNTILFLQKGNEFQKKKYPEIKHERIDGTHIKITGPDGTSKIMLSEIPLENTYPEFAALFPLRLGASLGVGGLPSLAYKLYKYYKGNKPQMYGRFDLGKKKSFSNVLLEENPLPVKILDALPFFKSGNKIHIKQGRNKIRKGEDGLKNFLGNSTVNSPETRNVSDHNLGRLYDELSKSKIPMNHTTREQFITRSKDVINAINKHFSGPEIPRVFRNALLTVALEETGLNPSNLYLYGIIGGLRNLYLQKFGGRKDSDSITHFIKKYFKGEYKNLGYSPKAIPSNVTDPREILTYYMTNLGDPSFFKRKNKGNTVAWKKWNEWLPIILNSNLIALNDSNFGNNKNLFNTFNNEPENNLNNVFNNESENDSYNIIDPNDLLKKLNKQSGNVMLSKNGNKLIALIPKGKTGIHIKKKNRGKFTDYCGGKVTDSCIRRAKASGNPTLIKRATFAANARKWKH